jgi:hypothetical protein
MTLYAGWTVFPLIPLDSEDLAMGARVLGTDGGLRAKATETRHSQAAMASTESERPRLMVCISCLFLLSRCKHSSIASLPGSMIMPASR